MTSMAFDEQAGEPEQADLFDESEAYEAAAI